MRRNERRRTVDEQGFSLIEILITVSIMSVVMVVVTSATHQIYSGVKQIDQTAFARDQIDIGFNRLNKELRYATWMSSPGKVDGRWYLEYMLPPVRKAAGATEEPKPRCRQLKLDGAVLTLAGWESPATAPTSQTSIVSGVVLADGSAPFVVHLPGTKPYATVSPEVAGVGTDFEVTFQQIRLRFDIRNGTTTLPFDNVFTAQNITRLTPKNNDCSKGRPVP